MKKIIALVILTITLMMNMSGCYNVKQAISPDKQPAVIEITTTKGNSYITTSVNGTAQDINGLDYAINHAQYNLNLEDGEEATLHFRCPACEYEVIEQLSTPLSKVFECECPTEYKDGERNCKEYFAITVANN